MITAGQSAEALAAVHQSGFRRLEAFTVLQMPGEAGGVDAHGHTAAGRLIDFGAGGEIAAVEQRNAPAAPRVLGGGVVADDHKGILLVAGRAAHAVHANLSVRQGSAFHQAFHRMTAPEVEQIKVAFGEVEAGGQSGIDLHRRAGVVDDPRGAGNGVILRKDRIQKHNLQIGPAVAQSDLQRLTVPVKGGQTFQRRLFREDPVRLVAQLRVASSVREGDGHAVRAVIAAAEYGVFLLRQVGGSQIIIPGNVRRGGKAHKAGSLQSFAGAAAQLFSKMQMLQKSISVDTHLV